MEVTRFKKVAEFRAAVDEKLKEYFGKGKDKDGEPYYVYPEPPLPKEEWEENTEEEKREYEELKAEQFFFLTDGGVEYRRGFKFSPKVKVWDSEDSETIHIDVEKVYSYNNNEHWIFGTEDDSDIKVAICIRNYGALFKIEKLLASTPYKDCLFY